MLSKALYFFMILNLYFFHHSPKMSLFDFSQKNHTMAEETGQNEPSGGLGEAEGASDRFSFINENTSELEQQGLLRIKDELREPGEPSPEATEGLAPSTGQESETVQITLTVGEESSQIETTDGQEPSTVLESKTLEITLTVDDEESSDSEEAVIDLTEDDKLKEECRTKKPVVLLESVKLDSSGSLKHFVNKKKKTRTDSDYEGECPNSPSSTSSYTSVEGEEPKGKRVKRQLYSPVQWDDGPRKARASAVKARASIAKLNEEVRSNFNISLQLGNRSWCGHSECDPMPG